MLKSQSIFDSKSVVVQWRGWKQRCSVNDELPHLQYSVALCRRPNHFSAALHFVLFINITSISTRNGIRTTSRQKFTRWTSREKGTAERRSLKIPDCFSLQGWNDSLRRQQCKNSCQLCDPILHSTLKLKLHRRCCCSGTVSTAESFTVTHLLWNFKRRSMWGWLYSHSRVPVTWGFHRSGLRR